MSDNPILHVCVIGFHHKKGCQLEYSYPPLCDGKEVDSHELPEEWKHLPSLALPDGAHNFDKDTIYFHLRSKNGSRDTVFGISCYRQMAAKDLINRTADVTRSSVQKSVCVISKLPLYGLIQAKLELITHAYFDERDFSKVELLEETYKNLNASVSTSMIKGSQAFLGMSARDLIIKFRLKILLLFKLILLERKVLVFLSPVSALNNILLALLSLFPGMIECGLKEAAGYSSRKLSEFMLVQNNGSDEYLELRYNEEVPIGGASVPAFVDTPDIIKSHIPPEEVFHGGTTNKISAPDIDIGTGKMKLTDLSKTVPVAPGIGVEVGMSQKSSEVTEKTSKTRKSSSDSFGHAAESCQRQSSVGSVSSVDSQNVICEQPRPSGGDARNPGKRQAVYNLSVDIDVVTHIEPVQQVSSDQLSEDVLSSPHEKSDDPLEFVDDITKVESVQELSSPKRNNEILDLDSPESLQEIDREDCFSWEDDKLLLEIEQELDLGFSAQKDDVKVSKSAPAVSTSDSNPEPNGASLPDTENCDKKPTDIEYYSEFYVPLADSDRRGLSVAEISGGLTPISQSSSQNSLSSQGSAAGQIKATVANIKNKLLSPRGGKRSPSKSSVDTVASERPYIPSPLEVDRHGFPLAVFTQGSICHPYLPLQYYDLLEDVNIRSFLIGATNILFKQKRHLTDVVIGEDDTKIDIHDAELKRQLNLTTADLRFADYIVKNVLEEDEDVYLDGTGWEGGEEWIRVQFRLYLMSLLASVEEDDEKLDEDFNVHFIRAWKTTHNYKVWKHSPHNGFAEIEPGHPFRGQISMADMKLKWAHSMQNTEKGRKINAAVHSTGKVVGSALTQAKGAISGWLSSWNKPKPDEYSFGD